MARGEAGYINATVSLTTGGSYAGGGVAGWIGGSTFLFAVYTRSPQFKRLLQQTTDGVFVSSVGGPVSLPVKWEGYFKGSNYPPASITQEFVLVAIIAIFTWTAVVNVEEFSPTGEVDGSKGVYYTFSGMSDGVFTQT